MILPFLKGLLGFSKAPVTWMIFLFSGFCYMVSNFFIMPLESHLDVKLKEEYFLKTQGRLYAQFISNNAFDYDPILVNLAEKVLSGDTGKLKILGSLAPRNSRFMREGQKKEFRGDKVAEEHWKRSLASIQNLQAKHPSYLMGINSEGYEVSRWFSYIFIHSGYVHFLGNMMFFLIFAGFLETVVGGLTVLVLFLGSGALSAGVFLLTTQSTAAPLVGASGAISGIMAYFCFLYWKSPVRFVYWLFLPFKKYSGFVYLPGWVAFVLWFISDLSGYFSSVTEFGGIAYTAHIGGELAGIGLGIFISFLRRRHAGEGLPHSNATIGELIPFFESEKKFSLHEN